MVTLRSPSNCLSASHSSLVQKFLNCEKKYLLGQVALDLQRHQYTRCPLGEASVYSYSLSWKKVPRPSNPRGASARLYNNLTSCKKSIGMPKSIHSLPPFLFFPPNFSGKEVDVLGPPKQIEVVYGDERQALIKDTLLCWGQYLRGEVDHLWFNYLVWRPCRGTLDYVGSCPGCSGLQLRKV